MLSFQLAVRKQLIPPTISGTPYYLGVDFGASEQCCENSLPKNEGSISIWPGIPILLIITAWLVAGFLGFHRNWAEALDATVPSWLFVLNFFFAPLFIAWWLLPPTKASLTQIVCSVILLASILCLDASKMRFLVPGLLVIALLYVEVFCLIPMWKKKRQARVDGLE